MTTSAEADLREVRERIIRSHLDAECRHDIAAALATFAEANYDVIPLGAPSNGAAAVEELLAALFAAFPDFSADMRALHHGDDIVFVDTTMRGTHRGTWPASRRAAGPSRSDAGASSTSRTTGSSSRPSTSTTPRCSPRSASAADRGGSDVPRPTDQQGGIMPIVVVFDFPGEDIAKYHKVFESAAPP